MFAFALYDTVEHRLLLARDRFGIKPPVYAAVEGAFYFASEVRPLRHCLELAAERLARRFKLDLHIVPVDDEEFLSLIPETGLCAGLPSPTFRPISPTAANGVSPPPGSGVSRSSRRSSTTVG